MDTAQSVLVVVLAAALAVFLILAITIAIEILRLVSSLREIAKRAERVVTSAETVGDVLRKTSGSVSIIHFVRTVLNMVAEHKDKKKES
ncbi:MAG TPA: hypothetical protein VGS08_02940 [Candidatus Saccharimonadales bacterium]|nr:hypothetical protein [Candidatus Saccharimonadales bacterium]